MDNLLKRHMISLFLLKIENKILKDTLKSIQRKEKLNPKNTLFSTVINVINIIVFEPAKYSLFTTIEFLTGYKL